MASLESEEIIDTKLQPLVIGILTNFAGVLDSYQGAALIALIDCVATLAEVLGERLRSQEIVDLLIPLLSRKWQQLEDNDKRLLPLFECFENVIHAIGDVYI